MRLLECFYTEQIEGRQTAPIVVITAGVDAARVKCFQKFKLLIKDKRLEAHREFEEIKTSIELACGPAQSDAEFSDTIIGQDEVKATTFKESDCDANVPRMRKHFR